MFNKKSQAGPGVIAKAIWVLVAALVLIILVGVMYQGQDRAATDKQCLANVLQNAYIKSGDVKLENCPAYPITFERKDLAKNNDLDIAESWIEKYGMEQSPEMYVLNKKIAEEMESCWNKLGAPSDLNPFTSWGAIWEKEAVCVICSTITFEEGAKNYVKDNNDDNTNVKSLKEWLTHNPIPGQTISYYEYFKDRPEQSDLVSNFEYDVGTPLDVIYVVVGPGVLRKTIEMGGNVLSAFGITEAGESSLVKAVILIPHTSESLNEFCKGGIGN